MPEIPILLLAAGSSSRMGKPKQLLPWGSTTLIEHQIQILVKTGYPVNVILGFGSDIIIPLIKKYPVNIFSNDKWENGIGSSVSAGITQVIRKFPKAAGVLISLLDQPLLTTDYFENMLGSYKPGAHKILVSQSVSGWRGVPALFDKYYFKDLLKLKDDEGAKKIIQRFEKNIIVVEGGKILEDMDTPESYKRMLSEYLNQS
jgi:molybdenum cofactor cytidylyltransferase